LGAPELATAINQALRLRNSKNPVRGDMIMAPGENALLSAFSFLLSAFYCPYDHFEIRFYSQRAMRLVRSRAADPVERMNCRTDFQIR